MSKNFRRSLHYSPSDYDDNLTLKLSVPAWLIIAFIMRPFLIFLASVTNKADRFGLLNLVYADPSWALLSSFMALPTIVLLISWSNRKINAKSWVLFIWARGRYFLATSLALNIILLILSWLFTGGLNSFAKSQIILCSLMIYYVIRSTRLRDTFSDFPGKARVKLSQN